MNMANNNFATPSWNLTQLEQLLAELGKIHSGMSHLEAEFADRVKKAHPSQHHGARNLLHYLALRQRDVRQLQERLTALGLSSLGRTESHVMATIEAVMKILSYLAQRPLPITTNGEPVLGFSEGKALLEAHTEALLGPKPANRNVRIQEEILWLCEAAHRPAIWATQVLENLAQKGQASRAEITDAAMGGRAECVMLNKGPYILEAVRVLDDILQRMQSHRHNKKSMLRKLKLAHIVKGD